MSEAIIIEVGEFEEATLETRKDGSYHFRVSVGGTEHELRSVGKQWMVSAGESEYEYQAWKDALNQWLWTITQAYED